MEEEGLSFKCKDCGSTELYFDHDYSVVETIVDMLECDCDSECEFAARRIHYVTTDYSERMLLDEEHHSVTIDGAEKIERVEEEGDYEVQCHDCLNKASENDWIVEVEESDIDEESAEYYVRCAGCLREIEFGWSHPERGGRIWPIESSDFNPWKSWPEPRYRIKWLGREWVRPDFRGI